MKRYICLIFAIVLTSCVGTAQAQSVRATPTMQAKAIQALQTQPPPMVAPSATPDYATMLTASHDALIESDAELQQAMSDKLAAQISDQNSRATAIEADVQRGQLTQSAAELGATVTAEANQVSKTQQVAVATQGAFIIGATQTGVVLQTNLTKAQTAKVEAERDKQMAGWIVVIMIILSLAIIIPLVVWAGGHVRSWFAPAQISHDVNEMEDVPAQPSAPVRGWERVGDTINRDTEPPGEPEKFRALIRHAERNNSLGKNNVIIAKIYSGYPEYTPVLDWLEGKLYTETSGSGAKVFSRAGIEFCRNWELIHPAPPSETPKNSTPDGYNHDVIPEGGYRKYEFSTERPKRRKG